MPIDHDRKLQLLRAAGERWERRDSERAKTHELLIQGGAVAAEPAARVRAHVDWMGDSSRRSPLIAIERQIGKIDFVDAPPTPEAGVAARAVARIVEAAEAGFEPLGFGTGFMVAPGVLMTNNHVISSHAEARFAAANYGYRLAEPGPNRVPIPC